MTFNARLIDADPTEVKACGWSKRYTKQLQIDAGGKWRSFGFVIEGNAASLRKAQNDAIRALHYNVPVPFEVPIVLNFE